MSITALVMARSGSKRLPEKNVEFLGGKSLVQRTFESFLVSISMERVFFSTEFRECWDIPTSELNLDKIELGFRSPTEAGAQIKILNYSITARNNIFAAGDELFFVGLLTLPFRRFERIEAAFALHRECCCPVFPR